MSYKCINTTSGEVKNCNIPNLSQKLHPNTILAQYVKGECVASYPITYETVVFFAVEFADYALKRYSQKCVPQNVRTCITQARKWLADPHSVDAGEMGASHRSILDSIYGARVAADCVAAVAAAAAADYVPTAYSEMSAVSGADYIARHAVDVATAAATHAAYAAVADAARAAAYAAHCAANAADRHALYTANSAHIAAGHAATAAATYAAAAGADAPRVKCIKAAEYVRQGEFIMEYLRGGSI